MIIDDKELKNINIFKLDDNQKIKQISLQKALNKDNKTIGLVEINVFGCHDVYTLIDFSKVSKFNYFSTLNYIHDLSLNDNLILGKIEEDSPIIDGINCLKKPINLRTLTKIDWITIYQLGMIINGMNNLNRELLITDTYYFNFGSNIDYADIMDNELLDFSIESKFKYILVYDNNYLYSNTLPILLNFDGVYVYIPEFNCYQYLSTDILMGLSDNVDSIEIEYRKKNIYGKSTIESYLCESLYEVLKYSIYIPINVFFKKIFELIDKNRDMIYISINKLNENISLELSLSEIGIINNPSGLVITKTFDLLYLINSIIRLQPYK